MSLVTYSDSEDDTDGAGKELIDNDSKLNTHVNGPKRKRSKEDEFRRLSKPPPPLPSGFTTLYASTVRSSTSDDPTLHSGRTRQIPHIEGNWPSFVYLEWLPSLQDLASLEDVIACIAEEHADTGGSSHPSDNELQSSLRSELGVRLPLHVSLSAPLTLTTENKDAFKEDLTRTINGANITAFRTTPSFIRWVKNFDGTRHFLILTLSKPKQEQLQSILSVCNRIATIFRLPQLYMHKNDTDTDSTNVGVVANTTSDPANTNLDHIHPNHDNFHISIAWSLKQIHTSQTLMDQLREKLKHMAITFDKVYIKIGNHVSSVPLRELPAPAPAPAAGTNSGDTE